LVGEQVPLICTSRRDESLDGASAGASLAGRERALASRYELLVQAVPGGGDPFLCILVV